MKLKQTEKELQNAILDWLHAHKIHAVPVYNGGVYDPVGGFYRVKNKAYKGVADIWAVNNGKSIAIEVKVGSNSLSPEQREFLLSHYKSGGLSWVIREIEDLENCFNYRSILYSSKFEKDFGNSIPILS